MFHKSLARSPLSNAAIEKFLMCFNEATLRAHNKINIIENVLTLDGIKASLYGGTLKGMLSANHFRTEPQWQWDMQVDNIQLQPLLEDVNGVDSKIKLSGAGMFGIQA